jgi:signal peptidase II
MLHPIKPEYVIPKLLGDRRGTVRGGRRESDHEPKRGWVPAFTIALGIALADWIVKAWVAYTVPVEGFRPLGGRVALWHVQNHAMILGLWDNFPLGTRKVIAVVASVLGSLVLLQIVGRGHRFTHGQRRWAWLFVGLVLGGMLGNLGERVVHWAVTDYLSFRWGDVWLPPGNVADVALFLSIPLAVPVIAFEVLGRMRRGRAEQQTVTLREVEAEPSV